MDAGRLRPLVEADALIQEGIEDLASAAVRTIFGEVSDWHDPSTVSQAATRAGATVRSAARSAAAQADAYLTSAITATVGAPATPSGVISVVEPLRAGATGWSQVYERTAATVRLELSRGRSLEQAVQAGLDRADAMCRTDIALARRQQWRSSLTANPRIIGFRRIIHPELSKDGTCGLCIAASDRRYTKRDLLPIHDRCKCTVSPITNVHDPGGQLNQEDLDALYREAGSTKADDLKATRYKVVEHGELGPRLVNAEHKVRTPRDVARDTGRRDPGREIAALEKTHARLSERVAAGDESAREALDWQTRRLEKLRREQAAA